MVVLEFELEWTAQLPGPLGWSLRRKSSSPIIQRTLHSLAWFFDYHRGRQGVTVGFDDGVVVVKKMVSEERL